MNKKLIILTIILVCIALTGLMSIQIYWIRNAILVKESVFKQNVNNALSDVIFKLELMELKNEIDLQLNLSSNKPFRKNRLGSLSEQLNKEVKNSNDLNLFKKKFDLEQGVMNYLSQAYKSPPPIQKRVKFKLLDSLINIELYKKGIETEYEYGIYDEQKRKMVHQKTGKYPDKLLNLDESFSFVLFPGDINLKSKKSFLLLYFPNEKQYIIRQMSTMLIISLVLIITIILSFYYTIITVFKQKKLSTMRNDFINNMTHEFKTPISTIALACEALKDKDIIKTETLFDNYIGIIGEENNRLKGMAEKVLQTAILEKGELKLKIEWVNLQEVIKEVIKKINIQVERKDGKILSDLAEDTIKLKADRMHLTNLIMNLIDNANKYNLGKPEIVVSAYEKDQEAIIEIKDNGIGISKENQKKIFDKLYRVPTGNVHNFKGFGLGLSYVKAIVDKHGGRITVSSELNHGTTFKIFLPFGDIN